MWLVVDIGEADHLEAHPTPGHERPIARLEECLEVLRSHRLEHLDRDDRVVGAVHVAVIAQLDLDEVLQAGSLDALSGKLVLRC